MAEAMEKSYLTKGITKFFFNHFLGGGFGDGLQWRTVASKT